MRNHPLLVATTAASAGVMLGAYVAVQLLVTPPTKNDDGARPAMQAATDSKAVQAATDSKAVRAETTGQAASGDREGTTTDCSKQTWPYLSRDCVEQSKSGPRVVSTDKLDQPTVNAIENPPALEKAEPPAQASVDASAAVPAAPPVAAVPTPPAAPAATPATTVPVAAPAQAVTGQDAVAADAAPPKATRNKHAKKPKQKSKPDDRALAKADDNDDDNTSMSRESNEERRISSSPDRSRRIGERWNEREEYDVPSFDGRGQRRVTVIRRNGGGSVERIDGDGLFERRGVGGPFGGLFGFR